MILKNNARRLSQSRMMRTAGAVGVAGAAGTAGTAGAAGAAGAAGVVGVVGGVCVAGGVVSMRRSVRGVCEAGMK